MCAAILPPYTVRAYNMSRESENKIHDDSVAQRFGFTGGLVPGVEVYAYAMHPAVARWGRDWLQRGAGEARFQKPVYDGHEATVQAAEDGTGLSLKVESDGALCATGHASLPEAASLPDASQWQAPPPPALAARPKASPESLPVGGWLATNPFPVTSEFSADYLQKLEERETLYAAEGIVHPGIVLRLCNQLLVQNVLLGPWIHVGSTVRNHAIARIGDVLTGRARVTANYERKGHLIVELDCIVLANGATVVAQVAHNAVYRPRQVAQAA